MKATQEVEAAYKAALEVTHKYGANNDKEKNAETQKALVEAQVELATVISGLSKRQIMQLAGYTVYKACFGGVNIANNTWDLKKSEHLLNVLFSIINAVKGTRKDDDCRQVVGELHSRKTSSHSFLRLSYLVGYKPEYGMTVQALEEVLKKADRDIELRGADNQPDENRETARRVRDAAKPLRDVLRSMKNAQKKRGNSQERVNTHDRKPLVGDRFTKDEQQQIRGTAISDPAEAPAPVTTATGDKHSPEEEADSKGNRQNKRRTRQKKEKGGANSRKWEQ